MIFRICLAVTLAMAIIIGAITAHAEIYAGHPRVLDGDTIMIGEYKIRFHGIDAPELRQQCLDGWQTVPCGQMSKQSLETLILDNIVFCRKLGVGRYGRIIGKCFIGEHDLQAEMVRWGWAVAYRRYSDDYVAIEERAKSNLRGIWGWSFINPEEWRRGYR